MATQEESQVQDCKEFLQKFERWADPTWGFFVYGTYTRPQGQAVSNEDGEKGNRTGQWNECSLSSASIDEQQMRPMMMRTSKQ